MANTDYGVANRVYLEKENIELSKLKIELLLSEPKLERKGKKGERYVIQAKAIVSQDKKPVEYVFVEFSGLDPNLSLTEPVATDSDGGAPATLHFNIRHEGETAEIRVQVCGVPDINDSGKRKLVPNPGKGLLRQWRTVKYNFQKRVFKMSMYVLMIWAISWFSLYLSRLGEGRSLSLIIAVVISLLLHFILLKDKTKSLKVGGVLVFVSVIFPGVFTQSFRWAAWYLAVGGLPFYILEELTYQITEKRSGDKVELTWEKLKNFYPTYPVVLCIFFFGYHLIMIPTEAFFSPEIKQTLEIGAKVSSERFYGLAPAESTGGALGHILCLIDWVVAGLATALIATPQEIIAIFKGSKTTGEALGITVFFKEMWDILKKFFGFKALGGATK